MNIPYGCGHVGCPSYSGRTSAVTKAVLFFQTSPLKLAKIIMLLQFPCSQSVVVAVYTVCMLMLLSCWPVCTGVTGQGIDCRLPEDDTIVSKHVAV